MTSLASDQSRGLSLFANATVHDKKTNAIDNYVQAGLVYKGPFDARAKDDIGFALARVHVNPAYRKNARLVNQAAGIDDYDNPGFLPVQATEYSAELYSGIRLADWLPVRPNLPSIPPPLVFSYSLPLFQNNLIRSAPVWGKSVDLGVCVCCKKKNTN